MTEDESDYSINSGIIPTFGMADYVMFVLTLVISSSIGILYAVLNRHKNTTKEFLLGGQDMNPFPVAFSLMVTFMSAMTLLGNPAEVYNYHTMWWWLVVGMVIAMWWVGNAFIPFFYQLGIDSVFEYLEMRFESSLLRVCGSLILILQTLIYMAFLLYAPALALNAVTGLNLWGCVIAMGCVGTFYTTLGGMKAVLWTDTFQFGVIFTGLLAVLVKGSIVEGGFSVAWQKADERGRIKFNDFNPDPRIRHSVWSMVIGGWAFWMHLYGVNQAQIQRCLSCSSVKMAQFALWINFPGLVFIVSTCTMIGVVMFAFYRDCDPISYGLVKKTDQLVPLYAMDILGKNPGLPGIFVSCVFSGSLSSFSSGLNALAAVTLRDIVEKSFLPDLNEYMQTFASKVLVFSYGVSSIILAYGVSNLGSVLQAVYIVFGVLNGPLLGIFTLGMFYPWANKKGAFGGLLFSLVFLFWIGIGSFVNGVKTPVSPLSTAACNFTAKPLVLTLTNTTAKAVDENSDPFIELYRLSYMYYTFLGMVLVHVGGLVVSFFTGPTRPETLDPRLICPLVERLLPFLSEETKKKFRFGIDHVGEYAKNRDVSVDEKASPAKEPALDDGGVMASDETLADENNPRRQDATQKSPYSSEDSNFKKIRSETEV